MGTSSPPAGIFRRKPSHAPVAAIASVSNRNGTLVLPDWVDDGIGSVPEFVAKLREENPAACAGLLAKILPPPSDPIGDGSGGIISEVTVVAAAAGAFVVPGPEGSSAIVAEPQARKDWVTKYPELQEQLGLDENGDPLPRAPAPAVEPSEPVREPEAPPANVIRSARLLAREPGVRSTKPRRPSSLFDELHPTLKE